jgi:steroid delta-isomerase-like uncharacterized protein
MSTEQNKALIRRFIEEVLHQGRLEVADELIATHAVRHGLTPAPALGSASVKQSAVVLRNAFPDVHSTIDDMVAEGDKIAYRWTLHGTHQGEFMGVQGSGKAVTFTGMTIARIVNGQIVEFWEHNDRLGLMQQLGLLPTEK